MDVTNRIEMTVSREIPRPDRMVASLARGGDRGAREEFAREVGRSAYLFALQLTGNPDTAQDVAQDSVLSFFRRLDLFDSTRPIEPWLYQIVRNRVRDRARRERLRQHESLDGWLEIGLREVADSGEDPALEAERSATQREVWRAISRLPDAHRKILVLRDFHDLTYRELAEVLSLPQGTVMSRLHAARRRLRDALVSDPDGFFSERGGTIDG